MTELGAAASPPANRSARGATTLALFDLDGTLTRHDTLSVYLAGFLRRHPVRTLRLARVLRAGVSFALGARDRGALKSAAIRAVLGGCTRSELERWNAEFVPRLLRSGMHGDALACVEAHRRAGDFLVLLSASPDLYVPAIGRALGFTETLCTGIAWQDERVDGHLTTPNRRDTEKVRCVEELRRQHPGLALVAYANSTSDLDHLALADRATLVNGSAAARSAAARLNIRCVTWH